MIPPPAGLDERSDFKSPNLKLRGFPLLKAIPRPAGKDESSNFKSPSLALEYSVSSPAPRHESGHSLALGRGKLIAHYLLGY